MYSESLPRTKLITTCSFVFSVPIVQRLPGEPSRRAAVPQSLYTPLKDGTRRKRKEAILFKKAKTAAAVITSARRVPTRSTPIPTGKGQKVTKIQVLQNIVLTPSETKETLVPPEAPLPKAAPSAAPTPTESHPKLTLADRLDKYRTHLEWPTDIRLEIERRQPIRVPRHRKFRLILPPEDGGPRRVTIRPDTPEASHFQ